MDIEMLKERLSAAGIKMSEAAKRLGVTRQGFYNKLSGCTEFKSSEIRVLSDMLKLSSDERDQIFFRDYVDESDNNQ